MTARLYYTDSYCRQFEAVVTRSFEHEGRPSVLLDRTAFYPESGGQPCDTGRLGGVDVVEVIDSTNQDEGVVHVLSSALAEGTRVHGDVDWVRRFDHMQQHTGQHVLSAAFDRLLDNRTMSFHMGSETATIDLAREMAWRETTRAEDEANRIVWDDREVSIRFVSAQEAAALPLRKEPMREGRLRLIEISDFDLSACGGTHVTRTGAIGMIAVLGAEKFKGGTRITFACGGRALRALRTLRESVAGSVRVLSVLPQELPAAIERVQTEGMDLRKTIKRIQERLAQHEAARLAADSPDPAGLHVVVQALDGWDAAGLKAIAVAITARTRAAVALLSTASPIAVVIARASDVRVDASAVLRALTERFGGRGGGKPDLAQGGGLTGDLNEITRVARELLEAQIR